MHPRDFMGFDSPYFDRIKEEVNFTTCVRDFIEKVEDIIMIDSNPKQVSIDIFIDILTDQDQKQDSLELWALKQIKSKGIELMKVDELLNEMTRQIRKLQLSEHVGKWWQSFKRAGNGGGKNSFQIKKIREYMQKMDGMERLTYQQEVVFKNRNDWTYNELLSSCTKPS